MNNILIIDKNNIIYSILNAQANMNKISNTNIHLSINIESAKQKIDINNYNIIIVSDNIDLSYKDELMIHLTKFNSKYPVIFLTNPTSSSLKYNNILSTFSLSNLNDLISFLIYNNNKNTIKQCNILVIEDDPEYISLIKEIGNEINFKPYFFKDTNKAINSTKLINYDLIIAESIIDKQSVGITILNKLKTFKKNIPVLIISTFNDSKNKINLLNLGVQDAIDKPIIKEEFKARINNLVLLKQLLSKVELQQQELKKMAITDKLTGLYNRHYLSEIVHQVFAESKRQNTPISLIIIDLDKFKLINDTYGHPKGDEVLISVANFLKTNIRQEDFVFRLGGEEFLILTKHTSLNVAEKKANQLREKLEQLDISGLNITGSFGVSTSNPECQCTFEDLFNLADEATYVSKNNGRNQVTISNIKCANCTNK